MSLTLFKLSQPGGLTRRFSYQTKPSWLTLSSKIEALYQIPLDKIAVSYIDNDGDQVTLSSEEELNDFYQLSHHPPQPIKFTVQDLRSLRESYDSTSTLPETPLVGGNPRNTFGGLFELDDDWQLPGLGSLYRPSGPMRPDSPHAYLEVVESDVTKTEDRIDKASFISSDVVDVTPKSLDAGLEKGKGRAYEPSIVDSISSTGSVLAEDAPPKHPLHVYDMSSHGGDPVPIANLAPIGQDSHSTASTIMNPSAGVTPDVLIEPLNAEKVTEAEDVAPDPPLPSLDMPPQTPDNGSLSHDFITLFDTLKNIISSHPELSDALRNIAQNTTNGAYWQAHRDAISRGAEEIVRTAQKETGKAAEDLRRIAEEDAGRRITEALEGVVHVFSDIIGGGKSTSSAPPAPAAPENVPKPPPTVSSPNIFNPFPPPPPPPPPLSLKSLFSDQPQPWPHPPPPHPLPPRAAEWYGPIFSPPGQWRPWAGAQPAPPQVPPPGSAHPSHHSPPASSQGGPPHSPVDHTSDLTSKQLKAQVELAKSKYKAEKQRYRAHLGRKKHGNPFNSTGDGAQDDGNGTGVHEGDVKQVPNVTDPPVAHIVSNARGPYPQLEMFSVPTKRPRESGPPFVRRHDQPTDNNEDARAMQRISRKLSDMGFTESSYPTMAAKIKAQVPTVGHMSKENEDNIVTTVLEELLAMTPNPPVASGSNMTRDRDLPGAWR